MMINQPIKTVSDPNTMHCLVNPEPITVKGIKTFHPAFFHIYSGKKDIIHQFKVVAEKKPGCSLGAIFQKTTKDQNWMGKVGEPKGLLRNDPHSVRTRNKIEMNLDTIREKLAYDLFQELGRGLFLVPKTRLSLQPIRDPFNLSHWVANDWVQNGITESLRIMSCFMDGYSDLAHATTLDGNEKMGFMKYLEKYHRSPETILNPEGHSVPLEGIMELLAVGRCLADVDLLGGAGLNAGFIWEKENRSARAVKIDPGYAFSFTHDDPKNSSVNFVINTKRKLGERRDHLKDLKDIQTSTGNLDTIVHWDCLTEKQREKFIAVLLNASRYLESKKVLSLLFYREGKFGYPDPSYTEVAHMPKEIAKRMSSEMKEWIQWQLEIYAEPLLQFRKKYPEQLLRIHYLDHLGELALPMKKETFPIRELFAELILVSDKDIKKNIIPEVGSFKETIHRLEYSSQKISLDRLFERHQKILLLGKAGIGKSTLCQKMAHDWASGKLWNDLFDVVYWIPLRQLNDFSLKDTAFLDGVIPHLFSHPFNPSKKTLLILDGYDEATDELAKGVDHLLGTSPFHILVTSRPGKVDQLVVDQKVENIGFSDQQIQTYINYFSSRHQKEIIPTTTGKELFALIKENPSLYPIAHIPLQLQMILSLYEKTGSVKQTSSLTNLYQIMTSELYDWYLRGQKKEEKENHFLRLGKIAYLGLQTGKLIIPHKKVQYLMQDPPLESGILKKIHGNQLSYCFVHLTFQEYLTALYIHFKPMEKQQKFILENRHKPNYQLVLAFLAGLSYSKTQNIEWFFSTLYQKSNTMMLLHSYLLELTLRCLNECIGLDQPLSCLDALIQENPTIWDTILSDGYTPPLSAANQRQNQAFYWLANRYPHLMDKTGIWVENKEVTMTLGGLTNEKNGNIWPIIFL